jgi:flagellar biosynthesis protein FliQ
MTAQQVFAFGQQGLFHLLMVAAPLLISALLVGLVVSIFQAATQINEATLSFVPKIVAAGFTPLNRVFSQDPPAGTMIPKGSVVTLRIV